MKKEPGSKLLSRREAAGTMLFIATYTVAASRMSDGAMMAAKQLVVNVA